MRTAIIFILTACVLGGGLFAYVASQPAGRPAENARRPTTAAVPPANPDDAGGPVGSGQDVWVQQFDRKTGDLASEFRADRYDPPREGLVNVINPEARFYLGGGQLLTVEAVSGKVVMPQGKQHNNGLNSMQAAPPDRGDLQTVTVSLYANDADEEPSLVCTLPNITFDNDTLRLATAATEIDGVPVPADRVPVRVRGADYDFDGFGLVIRWNQRDRHLEQLEIAHGRQLTIKNAGQLMDEATRPGKAPATRPATQAARASGARVPWLSVSAALAGQVESGVAPATTPAKPPRRKKRPRPQPVTKPAAPPRVVVAYRAIFNDEVVIEENARPVGHADQLSALFSFDAKKTDAAPATRPTDSPTDSAATVPATVPASRPATRKARGPGGLFSSPVAKPGATQPASSATQPDATLVIRWTGKLIVLPVALAESGLRSTTDRIVELFGSPVRLDRDGASVRAAVVRSRGEEGFEALGSEKVPVVTLSDSSGLTLATPSIVFDDATGEAVMTGASEATLPLDRAPATGPTTGPGAVARVTWQKQGRLTLGASTAGERTITGAAFAGGVHIDHPQLDLTGDALVLVFAPDAASADPALQSALATGHVTALLRGEPDAQQKLQTDRLTLATAARPGGSVAVRSVLAEGNVVASDARQRLTAARLLATLSDQAPATDAPATRPTDAFAAGQLERLSASGTVIFTTADGAAAAADELTVVPAAVGQRITLVGVPAAVSDGKSTLKGLAIVIEPDAQKASVDGAGTLQGVAQLQGDTQARPVTIAWTDRMDVDATRNYATFVGVQADFVDRDGAVQSAKAQRLVVTLADAPKPTTAQAATRPVARPGQSQQLAAGKVVKQIELREKVELSSILSAADGGLLRRVHLFAPTIVLSAGASGDVSAVTIPAAGRMLYDDARPPATRPVSGGPADPKGLPASGDSFRGATAVEWKKQMTYDPALARVTLEGDVQVVHKDPGAEPMRLGAQLLLLDLETAPATSPPATQPAAPEQRLNVRMITATGGVTFTAPKIRFDAAELLLDPKAGRVTARGSDRQPVEVYDESGVSSGSFTEGVWNLNTHQVERLKDFAGKVRN